MGLDIGTSGVRCVVLDSNAKVIASSYDGYKQFYPKPGWVEIDPLEILEKTRITIRKCLKSKKIHAKQITGMGVTNQRETTAVWNLKTGMPFYNAIGWQCTRSKNICEELKRNEYEETIFNKTGLPISTYFSATKIKWILQNIDKVRDKITKEEAIFGTVDTWIIWSLTGGVEGGSHITDYTNASRTMLMNLNKLDWDDELLEIMSIPRSILPEIRPSSDKRVYGYLSTYKEIPICGDLGDQHASLLGQTCYSDGDTKATYGTGGFVLTNTGRRAIHSKNKLITTIAYGLEEGKPIYAIEGSIEAAGSIFKWLKENVGVLKEIEHAEKIAGSIKDSDGVIFIPAFSGLYAPHWDMDIKGSILGLTHRTKNSHIIRAAHEYICYRTKELLDGIEQDIGKKIKMLKVDGTAALNNFLLQLLSDIIGKKIARSKTHEATVMGACYAAGLASGVWKNLNEIKPFWESERVFRPVSRKEDKEKKFLEWKETITLVKEINRTLKHRNFGALKADVHYSNETNPLLTGRRR